MPQLMGFVAYVSTCMSLLSAIQMERSAHTVAMYRTASLYHESVRLSATPVLVYGAIGVG